MKFSGQSLSQGYYQTTNQQVRKGFSYFITLPLTFISQLNRATADFVGFFVLSGTAFATSFLMSLMLDSTKRVWFPSCKIGERKS